MKTFIFLSIVVIILLAYCLYHFYLEILDYKQFTMELNDIICNKNKQLRRIEAKAVDNAGYQYYENPAIGFREIAELSKIKILDIDRKSNI